MKRISSLRMVVTDLDGTLLNSKSEISSRNLQTLRQLRQDGVISVVATGRNLFSCKKVLKPDLPIDYLLFSSGLGVVDWRTQSLLQAAQFDADTLQAGVDALVDVEADFMVHQAAPGNHHFWYLRKSKVNTDFEARIQMYRDYARAVKSPREMHALATFSGASQFLAVYPACETSSSSPSPASARNIDNISPSASAASSSLPSPSSSLPSPSSSLPSPSSSSSLPSSSASSATRSFSSSSASPSSFSSSSSPPSSALSQHIVSSTNSQQTHDLSSPSHSDAPSKSIFSTSTHEQIFSELRKRLHSKGMHVIRTTSPLDKKSLWVEVFPRDVNKGAAMIRLAEKLAIPLAEVMVIGNDFNDCDMLTVPQTLAFVVDNAPAELCSKYRCVSSNDADGFSSAVKEAHSALAVYPAL